MDSVSIDCVHTDTINDGEEKNNFSTEFLNTLIPSGMPPHELELKVSAPVIILHN